MIEGITYQASKRFSALAYSVEVKSRFIDQKNADGYYKGFANELNATSTGNVITIGEGYFLVQARMNSVRDYEKIVVPSEQSGKVGCIIAQSNTFAPDDDGYCKIFARYEQSYDMILASLKKENTFIIDADRRNYQYEIPIYSFSVGENGFVQNLTKQIKPIDDYQRIKELYDALLLKYENTRAEIDGYRDEIITRQGSIVLVKGQKVMSFDADTKADKKDVVNIIQPALEDFERRLESLGFKKGTFTVPSGTLSSDSFIKRQGNYVIGKIELRNCYAIKEQNGIATAWLIRIKTQKYFENKPEENSFVETINLHAFVEGKIETNYETTQGIKVIAGLVNNEMQFVFFCPSAEVPINIYCTFGYEALPYENNI